MKTRFRLICLAMVLVLSSAVICFADFNTAVKSGDIVDLTVTSAPNRPCWWPANNTIPYIVSDFNKHSGWVGPYWTRTQVFDSHVGTHFDAPQHFIPPPGFDNNSYNPDIQKMLAEFESKYGKRSFSTTTNDKVAVVQFVGPLRVVDVTYLVGTVPKSKWPAGPNITVDDIKKHEAKYGPIKAGDVVAFMTKHDDKYYKRFPEGEKLAAAPLAGKSEGWATPTPETVFYLFDKGVKHLAIDAPSMGAVTAKEAIFTHWAGLGKEMIYTEFTCNLDKVPADGSAFFAMLPLKTVGSSGDIGRAIAIKGPLAKALIASAATGKVVDLTTPISPDLPSAWPFHFPLKVQVSTTWGPNGVYKSEFKTLDEHTGTHYDAPPHFIPPPGFKTADYLDKSVQEWTKKVEEKYGPTARSTEYNDKVPMEKFCGPLKVIDVGLMEGKAGPGKKPVIEVAQIKAFEAKFGPLKPGDVVMFRTGYDDAYYKPFPEGNRIVADVVSGKAMGWPAPSPDFVKYLADKGVKHLVGDTPSHGGEDWLPTHTVGLGRGMIYTEMVMNTAGLPNTGAFYIFLPPKTEGGSGMSGRAIALLP